MFFTNAAHPHAADTLDLVVTASTVCHTSTVCHASTVCHTSCGCATVTVVSVWLLCTEFAGGRCCCDAALMACHNSWDLVCNADTADLCRAETRHIWVLACVHRAQSHSQQLAGCYCAPLVILLILTCRHSHFLVAVSTEWNRSDAKK